MELVCSEAWKVTESYNQCLVWISSLERTDLGSLL